MLYELHKYTGLVDDILSGLRPQVTFLAVGGSSMEIRIYATLRLPNRPILSWKRTASFHERDLSIDSDAAICRSLQLVCRRIRKSAHDESTRTGTR